MAGAKMIVGKNAAKRFDNDNVKNRENSTRRTSEKPVKNSILIAGKIIYDIFEVSPWRIDIEKIKNNNDHLNLYPVKNLFTNFLLPEEKYLSECEFIYRYLDDRIFFIWQKYQEANVVSICNLFEKAINEKMEKIFSLFQPEIKKFLTSIYNQIKFDIAEFQEINKIKDGLPEMLNNFGMCRKSKSEYMDVSRNWNRAGSLSSAIYFVPFVSTLELSAFPEVSAYQASKNAISIDDLQAVFINNKPAPQTPDYQSLLLQSDNSRCRLKVYPEDILTDPNLGHWDLFCPKDGKECGKWYEIVELPGNYKARNPLNDISENPVAIDFGTTGTVVAMRDEFGQISLLRIGARSEGKEPLDASSHYVNPTVIQIDNIKNLLEAWRELPYRLNVSFEDAQSSHEAKEMLNKNYERCLTGLKTWARGKKNANAPIISDAGKNELEISIAPVTSAADIAEDFAKLPLNPIELYAFFVGLYLNNQIVDGGRIFTEYYMTFPADFESTSRQRIVESFRRGLLRSLPPSLIYGSGWKPENLRVVERASEPVAYAAAILPLLGRKMPVQPKEQPEESTRAAIIEEIRQLEQDLQSKRNSRKKIAAILQLLENKKRMIGNDIQKLLSLKQDLEELDTEIALRQDELGEIKRKLYEAQGSGKRVTVSVIKPLEPSEEGVAFGVFDFGGGTTDMAIGLYRLPTEEEEDAKGWERVVDILDTAGDSDLGGEELVRRMVYEVVKENMNALRGNGAITFERVPGYPHIPGDEEIFARSLIARENSWKLGEKLRPIWEKGNLDNPENPDQVSETFRKAGGNAPNVILNVKVEQLKKILKERIAKGVEKFFVTMGQAFKRENLVPSEFHVVLASNSARSPLVEECFREKIAEILGGKAQGDDAKKIVLHPPLLPDENNPEAVTLKTGVAIGLLHLLPGEPMGMVMRQRKGGEAPFAFTVGPLRRGKLEPVLKRNANYGEWQHFGKVLEEGVSKFYYSASPLALGGELERSECREGTLKWPVEDSGKNILVKAIAPDKIVFALQKNGADADQKTEKEITLKQ